MNYYVFYVPMMFGFAKNPVCLYMKHIFRISPKGSDYTNLKTLFGFQNACFELTDLRVIPDTKI